VSSSFLQQHSYNEYASWAADTLTDAALHINARIHDSLLAREATNLSNEDTSVIIISSLIPTHPSIQIMNETYQSLGFLKGLSPTAPLYLAVDGLKDGASLEDRERLAQYVVNLKAAFNKYHQHILASDTHLHIGGNIKQAHDMVQTEYIYVIQHDFAFRRNVDHSAIVKSMREYPDILRLVRFNKRRNAYRHADRIGGNCTYIPYPVEHINGIHFWKTNLWSDK
jgi:hypothetical protein